MISPTASLLAEGFQRPLLGAGALIQQTSPAFHAELRLQKKAPVELAIQQTSTYRCRCRPFYRAAR
jgi:hypothetical protein